MRYLIAGAGPAGSLLACYLAARGHRVDVFERRPDPRRGDDEEGRSINLGLSARGVLALERAGLMDRVRPLTVPMRGRVVHAAGRTSFHPYGTHDEEILHSVLRRDLVTLLIDHAHGLGARFHFGRRVTDLDRQAPAVQVEGEWIHGDAVVGADGAFSTIRTHLHRGLRADHHQEFLPWGYKELTMIATPGFRLEALHVWPGGDGLIVAHPNRDNSLTATLFLPYDELEAITDPEAFFAGRFPDALPLLPDLAKEFAANPVGHLVSVRTTPWHHENKVVLIGDACHAVYPFYGQGMNSALEDCLLLDASLDSFAAFETARRPHTDVLDELSRENFVELRQRVASPMHAARKRADLLLARLLPGRWRPLYTMISHTTTPYADALARARKQEAFLRWGAAAVTAGLGLAALTKLAGRNTGHAHRSR
ncbi:FAD-dependent oxidoreductase [Nonomuraea soli]|uniref:Kynurenine 3-monooxygenase n=1 Tax=Nonomuraea soli TaxID=1032476 RepID=A0A7W0CNJ0_9ACTN|nr:NAD(P)/FAD-dependent oxidoreductase [Nonomuraea soli]MBA2894421.1 kynurenine 3-monooxygenase [Nonomuraea soli]